MTESPTARGAAFMLTRRVCVLALPGLVGLGVAWVMGPSGFGGTALGLVAATAAATWIALRERGRLRLLRQWASRLARGERASPPLMLRNADDLDALAREVGELVDDLGAERMRLANERDRLEAILGAMFEGVIVIDASGTVLRANERVREIFGLGERDSLVDRRLWDLSRDVEFNAIVREALAGTAPTYREIEIKGAIHRWLRVTVGPTADGHAWVLVFHDQTATKQLERVRTDFVANVSHELRTPLTAIKGFAETLLTGRLVTDERAKRFLGIIDRQAERLSRLIDDLLTLSDLELGRSSLSMRSTSLLDTARDVAELLSDGAQRGDVAMVVDIDPRLEVACDADRLSQVLSNLVDNAIKYTPPGGRVEVAAAASEDGLGVEITVADTGQGIPAEDLPRVTERFYRVDKARSRELGGTGLGLSIVKHIVQGYGGRLEIESRVGEGTRIRVVLPRGAGDLDPEAREARG